MFMVHGIRCAVYGKSPALGRRLFQIISNSVIDFAFKCFSDASDRTVPFQFLYVRQHECGNK